MANIVTGCSPKSNIQTWIIAHGYYDPHRILYRLRCGCFNVICAESTGASSELANTRGVISTSCSLTSRRMLLGSWAWITQQAVFWNSKTMSLQHQLLLHHVPGLVRRDELMDTWNVFKLVTSIVSMYQVHVGYVMIFRYGLLLRDVVIWSVVLVVLSNLWTNRFRALSVGHLFKT
jgi:hypothetical protein